jgi:hypothetical protein
MARHLAVVAAVVLHLDLVLVVTVSQLAHGFFGVSSQNQAC